jgi:hypothetical protein
VDETGQPGAATPGENGNGAGHNGDRAWPVNGWTQPDPAWSGAGPVDDHDGERAQPRWRPPAEPAGGQNWADPASRYADLPAPFTSPSTRPASGPPAGGPPGRPTTNGFSRSERHQRQSPLVAVREPTGSGRAYDGDDDLEQSGRIVIPAVRPAPSADGTRPDGESPVGGEAARHAFDDGADRGGPGSRWRDRDELEISGSVGPVPGYPGGQAFGPAGGYDRPGPDRSPPDRGPAQVSAPPVAGERDARPEPTEGEQRRPRSRRARETDDEQPGEDAQGGRTWSPSWNPGGPEPGGRRSRESWSSLWNEQAPAVEQAQTGPPAGASFADRLAARRRDRAAGEQPPVVDRPAQAEPGAGPRGDRFTGDRSAAVPSAERPTVVPSPDRGSPPPADRPAAVPSPDRPTVVPANDRPSFVAAGDRAAFGPANERPSFVPAGDRAGVGPQPADRGAPGPKPVDRSGFAGPPARPAEPTGFGPDDDSDQPTAEITDRKSGAERPAPSTVDEMNAPTARAGYPPRPTGPGGDPAAGHRPDPVAEALPQRVPAEPDVPIVPEPPGVEPPAETPELARIATHLRREDAPTQPSQRPDGFDVQAILAAVRGVPGVRDASLRTTQAGAHSLRLDLADGADPAEVSRQVARLLQDRMGLAAAPQNLPGGSEAARPWAEPPAVPRIPRQTRGEDRPAVSVPAGAPTPVQAPAAASAETRRRRQSGQHRGRATVDPLPTGVAAVSGPAGTTGPGAQVSGSYASGQQATTTETAPSRPINPDGPPGPRVVLDHVQVTTFGLEATVEVRLVAGERRAEGVCSGPAVDGYVLRLAAAATALAVDDLLRAPDEAPEQGRCFIEHAAVVPFGNCDVATVVLLLVCDGWVEQLAGSALVSGDPRQAVVRATLAAVNRRLEALLA